VIPQLAAVRVRSAGVAAKVSSHSQVESSTCDVLTARSGRPHRTIGIVPVTRLVAPIEPMEDGNRRLDVTDPDGHDAGLDKFFPATHYPHP
jgi:hypothetical protein